MPPLPPVPATLKLSFEGTYLDSNWVNILYCSYSGSPPSEAVLNTFCEDVGAQWAADFGPIESEHLTLTLVKAVDLSSDLGAVGSFPFAAVGALTGGTLPVQTAIVTQKVINRRYRGGHPRMYMVAGDITKLATSSSKDWAAAFVTAVNTAVASFAAAFPFTVGANSFGPLVNVSYVSGGTRRVTPVVDQIAEYVTKSRLCSQRRRLGKVGG